MTESRTKKSAKNVISSFGYQLITLVLSFVSRTIFISTLGEEYLGLNGIFADVLTLLSMADLGFGTAMAFSFYKPLAEDDRGQIKALVKFYQKLYNIVAVAVLVLGLGCIPFLHLIVRTDEPIEHLTLYYLFALANTVISYLFVYKTTLMTADQKDYKIVNIRMITETLRTVLQIVSLLLWKNYVVYLALGVVTNFANNFVATKMTEREYPYIVSKTSNQEAELEGKLKKSIFENMKSMFIYKFSTTVFSATDNILISVLVGTAIVGRYSNYLMLSNKLLLVEQLVFSALTASVGNLIAKENAEKKHQIFETMQSASFIFCGIITVGFAVVVDDVIRIWLHNEAFVLDSVTVIAITINTYLACVLAPLWTYRQATGLYMKTKYIMAIAAIENLVLSVILGNCIGLAGIIAASAIARVTTYFWYEPKLLYEEYFETSPKSYYFAILKHVVFIAVFIAALKYALSFWTVTGWGGLLVKIGIVGSVSTSCFLLLYRNTEGFGIISNKIKAILKRG